MEQMKFSVFCSGRSIDSLTDKDVELIKKVSTTVFLNYAPSRFDEQQIDFLFWRDKEVTAWLKKQYAGVMPKYKLVTMEQGLRGHEDFKENVTIHENKKKDLNYSITCVLDMLFSLYPDCTVYLFGHDMDMKDEYVAWYDEFIDKPDNGNRWNTKNALPQQLEMFSGYRIYNCNPKTRCIVFPKVDFFNHIGVDYVR